MVELTFVATADWANTSLPGPRAGWFHRWQRKPRGRPTRCAGRQTSARPRRRLAPGLRVAQPADRARFGRIYRIKRSLGYVFQQWTVYYFARKPLVARKRNCLKEDSAAEFGFEAAARAQVCQLTSNWAGRNSQPRPTDGARPTSPLTMLVAPQCTRRALTTHGTALRVRQQQARSAQPPRGSHQ